MELQLQLQGDKVTVGVDTNTIGANIKLKYKSNSDAGTTQEVKLSDGLDFKMVTLQQQL